MQKRASSVRIGCVLTVLATAGLVGCSGLNDAVRPSSLSSLRSDLASASESPSHGLPLAAVVGSGSGIVNVTANARNGQFTSNTQDAIHVHGVAPNTVLYVRAAADAGLPDGQQADGVCQRASLGQFQPLLEYPGGPPATLETSTGGAGATHVVFGITNPFVPEGASLDVVLRLVDALPPAAPTIDLRTPCFTLELK